MERAHYQSHPLLGGLEVLDASFEKQTFSRHMHEGFTIGLIRQGAQRFWRHGANHIAARHSVILVNAEQIHDGHSATEGGWSYDAFYPTPDQIAQISCGLGLTNKLPFFPNAVESHPLLSAQLNQLFQIIKTEHNPLAIETLLHQVMLTLCCQFSQTRQSPVEHRHSKNVLTSVRDYLHDHAEQPITLTELSELASLSTYHLVRQFKAMFGLPPHRYQLQVRVQKAKQLLHAKRSVADVATSLGFHDQSHFHRHFKQAYGITPKQYQRATSYNY